jgi:hypothetical protein
MRIELNGFVVTKLQDGKFKATNGYIVFCTASLDKALDFIIGLA